MTHTVVPSSWPSALQVSGKAPDLSTNLLPLERVQQLGHCSFRGNFRFKLILYSSSVLGPKLYWFVNPSGTIGEALQVLRDAEGIALWLFHMTLRLASQQISFFFHFKKLLLCGFPSMNNPLQYLVSFLQNICQSSGSPILKVWLNYCYFKIELQFINCSFMLTSPVYEDCKAHPFQPSVCGSS